MEQLHFTTKVLGPFTVYRLEEHQVTLASPWLKYGLVIPSLLASMIPARGVLFVSKYYDGVQSEPGSPPSVVIKLSYETEKQELN